MSRRVRGPQRGFTLIEVLLSLAIFTLIGLATVRHIQQIQNTKTRAFEEVDLYDSIRAALSMIRNDLQQAFHVRYDDLGNTVKQAILQNQPAIHTLFDGRKSELVFTSLSHRVFYAGSKEAEQTEISYFLFKRDGAENASLMKRESERIDTDLFQGGAIYTLLDNVKSISFQYWDPKLAKWIDDWNSDNSDTRDRFPLAVKINLVVANPGKAEVRVQSEFKLAFPNNEALLANF